jgi:hypothetical protein
MTGTRDKREEALAETSVLSLGITCCALAIAIVLAIAIASAM